MTGGNISSIGEKDYGIIPRAVKTIFKKMQVSTSFFETRTTKETNQS